MPMPPMPPSPSRAAQLLLVDDDRLVLSTLSRGLQGAGYATRTAESTEEAEALLARGVRPDLAILDIRMRGRDGICLARRLREFEQIPFLMLSAYSEQGMSDEASRLGALAYLVKPLDTPQLLPAIEAALCRARELHELRETRSHLQKALDAERSISVATGMIMARHALDHDQAFGQLRLAARSQRRKLAELAAEIVQNGLGGALP